MKSVDIPDAWVTVPSPGIGVSNPWKDDIYQAGTLNPPKVINQNSGPWDTTVYTEFHQIVIGISRLTGTWYYNDFFSSLPTEVVNRYSTSYNVLNMPDNTSPKVEGEYLKPGNIPHRLPTNSVEASNLLFSLSKISSSKRYGGSLELLFEVNSDVGVEIRNNTIAWDLDDLLLKVYVNPSIDGLNNPTNCVRYGDVVCEFISSSHIAYEIRHGSEFEKCIDDHSEELRYALSVLADSVSNNIEIEAKRFVNGFIRVERWEQLDDDTKVIGIDISDNFLDLVTNGYEPAIQVKYRLTNINPKKFDNDGIEINVKCDFYGPSRNDKTDLRLEYSRDYTFELDEDQSLTSFENLGTYTFKDISNLKAGDIAGDIVFYFEAVDHDLFVDDHTNVLIGWFQFNLSEITAEWEEDPTSRYLGSNCYSFTLENPIELKDEYETEIQIEFKLDISLYLTKR